MNHPLKALYTANVAGLAAYIKKPQYGPALIQAMNIQFIDTEKPALCQLESTIILDDSKIPPFSCVRDSIIGKNVNIGAGTVLNNERLDKKEIFMKIKDKKVPTGRSKFGVVIGDHTHLGINTQIM